MAAGAGADNVKHQGGMARVPSMNTVKFVQSMAGNQSEVMKAALDELTDAATTDADKNVASKFPGFQQLFDQYLVEGQTKIDWERIEPPPEGTVLPLSELPEPSVDLSDAVGKLAVLKLNGGLGTSMGCKGPKSAITVRDGLTFLDLAVMQIEDLNERCDADVPLVLMNSFNTHKDTEIILRKYESRACSIRRFNQSQYPRIIKDTGTPAAKDYVNKDEWYPPGHGDLYRSLHNSGLLDRLIAEGKEYLFVSNIDNLGAGVDLKILNHFHQDTQCEFIMEVTDKTRADVKGGTLINYEGRTRLLEIAQVPKQHVDEFKSITKFRIFNTNNLWIRLSAIKRLITEEKLHMEVIENKKSMNGISVIQLEQAVGSAIKNFNGGKGINVPRSRFLPVKLSQDLMLVMSDLFRMNKGCLTLSSERIFPSLPLIKLGPAFKSVDDFLRRFASIPRIVALDHLTVSGNVTFGRNVSLRGTVIIIANEGERIDIPSNALLENKIVTGNLRILDH